jgi:hypothetical protein
MATKSKWLRFRGQDPLFHPVRLGFAGPVKCAWMPRLSTPITRRVLFVDASHLHPMAVVLNNNVRHRFGTGDGGTGAAKSTERRGNSRMLLRNKIHHVSPSHGWNVGEWMANIPHRRWTHACSAPHYSSAHCHREGTRRLRVNYPACRSLNPLAAAAVSSKDDSMLEIRLRISRPRGGGCVVWMMQQCTRAAGGMSGEWDERK